MNQKLYGNTKRLTTIFTVGILCLTVAVVALRLTVLGDMATAAPKTNVEALTDGMLHYRVNTEIYFANPLTEGNLLLESEESNTHLMKVTIVDDASGDVMIDTGLVQPGQKVNTAPLRTRDADFGEGIYTCTATISTHDIEDLTPVSSHEFPVMIYIGQTPDAAGGDGLDSEDPDGE